MSDIITDRSIQRDLVCRKDVTNVVTFGFSAAITSFTWTLFARQFGSGTNLISLTESAGLVKTSNQLVATLDVSNLNGEYIWYLFYAGTRSYFLINGALKVITGIYEEESNESEAVTVNLDGTDVTLTISPWPL